MISRTSKAHKCSCLTLDHHLSTRKATETAPKHGNGGRDRFAERRPIRGAPLDDQRCAYEQENDCPVKAMGIRTVAVARWEDTVD
ncbi:hypothetical protein GCM10010339_17680 [Streptomyces alanosinicus]|uniref:Uncharacterized protein n=1 Tax=Streptomyces alanosinicus TaxID=68171 RepID=A0A919D2H2_9ACTN|nr:hypothetical protein GCM10010339_17680 [Streptomyces alanosinicus]